MIHLIRMPPDISGLIRSGFSVSGKHGRLIYRTRDGKSHIYAIRSPKKEEKMAKIKYANFVTGLSGKSGSNVFYRSSSPMFGYLRDYVKPIYTDTNELRGKEFGNLGVQYKQLSSAAKEDFRAYARKYSKLPKSGSEDLTVRANNGMACFVAMMWSLKRSDPEVIQLEAITLTDMTTLFMLTSVKAAINEGHLPAVDGYEAYDADFV